jgi:hypothetical protein
VATYITDYFSASRRVAHHRHLFEIKVIEELREIVGVGVQVVTTPRLAGTTVPASIMRYDSIAALPKKQHLRIPGVSLKRPSVREGYDWARAPILIRN